VINPYGLIYDCINRRYIFNGAVYKIIVFLRFDCFFLRIKMHPAVRKHTGRENVTRRAAAVTNSNNTRYYNIISAVNRLLYRR